MSAAVIAGSFADYRLVKSRSVLQVIVEIPIEQQGAAFAALGYPLPGTEIPVAVARLNSPAGNPQPSDQERTTVADRLNGPQPKPSTPLAGETKERRQWHELSPSQQAGILCADGGFQKYASAQTGWACDADDAAAWLRAELDISSRKELDISRDAATRFNALHEEFLRWAGRVPEAVR